MILYHLMINVFVESAHTLVHPFDDRIDSSCKIDLCPSSVDTCDLNDGTLSCHQYAQTLVDLNCGNHVSEPCELMLPTSINIYVDQLVCNVNSLIEESCDVINKPLGSDEVDVVGSLKEYDTPPMFASRKVKSLGLVSCDGTQDCIGDVCHVDCHVNESSFKDDIYHFESEIACFDFSLFINSSLVKYNVLSNDHIAIESEISSGLYCNIESAASFGSYNVFENPL
ncbi:hypothetical protein K7X08_001079 [Anisodus acutangulus]|uniref:Uncharacterized protein n=1 Tax=Anisodus acutangulus TaxID=402998 RepID=A0A9Q1RMP0_9SOLA|nr:hypothetical protein K7X08_001079 [Anisodus acutangulus]